MKKILALIFVFVLVFTAGCGSTQKNAAFLSEPDEEGVELDLTLLSSTMIYSEVYNMRAEPDVYNGHKIRIKGLFYAYEKPDTGEPYFTCIIPDATACCSEGIQFMPVDSYVYPDDFPEDGTTITVVGDFQMGEENDFVRTLRNATFTFEEAAE